MMNRKERDAFVAKYEKRTGVPPRKQRYYSEKLRRVCPWFVLHFWKSGSEQAQIAYGKLYEETLAVKRRIEILEEKKHIIMSKMHEIWQDNDAPQAEEITMTSLLPCFC